jgi:hypothetical protein
VLVGADLVGAQPGVLVYRHNALVLKKLENKSVNGLQ